MGTRCLGQTRREMGTGGNTTRKKAWAGVLGVSEVGEDVADLGRRRVGQS